MEAMTTRTAALLALGLALGKPAAADETELQALKAEVNALRQELAELRAQIKTTNPTAAQAPVTTPAAQLSQQPIPQVTPAPPEWQTATSVSHLAGYAAVGYTDRDNGTGAFNVANFNPIFHFLYNDLLLWEAELEIAVQENGETELNLEYTTLDLFLNDYLTLSGGKLLSPLGQFRQNLHPAWINKLPSVPPGFGHDGAAPQAEIGLQARGAVPLGQMKANYAVYVGNGPELEAEDGELHGVETEGFARDADGSKVWGGRIGVLPLPKLEIGLSAATGDAAVATEAGREPSRAYDVWGADFAYRWHNLDLRSEFIQQRIGDQPASIAPAGGTWRAWYVQGAYRFFSPRWEGVLRYGDFTSPRASQAQRQWVLGLNYLFAPNVIAKLAYEFNDGLPGTPLDANRWLDQLAYGF